MNIRTHKRLPVHYQHLQTCIGYDVNGLRLPAAAHYTKHQITTKIICSIGFKDPGQLLGSKKRIISQRHIKKFNSPIPQSRSLRNFECALFQRQEFLAQKTVT